MRSLIDGGICRAPGVIHGRDDSVLLQEHDAGATLRELVITGVPASALIIDLDPVKGVGSGKRTRLKRYSWFFLDSHDLAAKQCDGALNFSIGSSEFLYLIELKSSDAGLAKGRKQLLAGKAFAEYIQALLGRKMTVRRRLVYAGPAATPPVMPATDPAEHREIRVRDSSHRAFITFGELFA